MIHAMLKRRMMMSSGEKSLNDYSWADISAISAAGEARNRFKIGDCKEVVLDGTIDGIVLSNFVIYACIIGINHNSSYEGNNKIHFSLGKAALKDGKDICFEPWSEQGSVANALRMNQTTTNAGGWKNSYMRNTTCPALLAAMPSDLQNVVTSCTKYTDNTGGGSNTASYVTATSDKIWIPSEFEILGVRSKANSAEQNFQKQYEYYSNGNSAIKYAHLHQSNKANYWTRSVLATNGVAFTMISYTGDADYSTATASYQFAPCFCV